ncbi:sigma-54-dependent transcriptional regulator [candidate division KSB1 bacterium]
MNKILIVEDDVNSLEGLKTLLKDEGYTVTGMTDAESAIKDLEKNIYNILLTDIVLPGMDGKELSRIVIEKYAFTKVIMFTGQGSVESAIEALENGIYYYLTKPIRIPELLIAIKKALDEQKLRKDYDELFDEYKSTYSFDNIIGRSQAMQDVFKTIKKVAKSNSTILIRGESGTGKEVIARAIHLSSPRANKEFIAVNCSSLPDTLLESELFGYEKGAFTGAMKTKEGRFELADGGTIFLDEIGDIDANIQVKLLRVLEDRIITRLGGTKSIKIDVRVITATNKNLEKYMQMEKFREDLYYRLNVIPIFLSPLTERKADIPLLIDFFLKKYSKESNKEIKNINQKALELLISYNWPGNVRELENAIENSVVMTEGEEITENDLPVYLLSYKSGIHKEDYYFGEESDLKSQLEYAEKMILKKALDECSNNKTKAADILDLSLRAMRYKVKKYEL